MQIFFAMSLDCDGGTNILWIYQCLNSVLIANCESGSSRFQPGEGPSRGLLRDYESSDEPFLKL